MFSRTFHQAMNGHAAYICQIGMRIFDPSACMSDSSSGARYVYADDLLRTADYKPHATRGSLEQDGDARAKHRTRFMVP